VPSHESLLLVTAVTAAAASLQMCHALDYMHSLSPPVLHRDINGNNVMIQQDDTVKLIDFGLAMPLKVASGASTTGHHTDSECGTPHFMSPEIISAEQKPRYSRRSDIWAFGCTVFQMVTGSVPYKECRNKFALPARIQQGAPDLPDTCSDHLRDFYKCCVMSEPKERRLASDLLNHRFLTE
jgi:serine/threonine protein kinase